MDEREHLNADDFIDRPPNRAECRRLLEELNGNNERIKAWNRLRLRFTPDHQYSDCEHWRPDISDKSDPWEPSHIYLGTASNEPDTHPKQTRVDLSSAIIKHASFYRAEITNAQLTGAIFDNCTFIQCDLSGSHLSGASFIHATARSLELKKCYLSRTNFSLSELQSVNLEDSRIEHANFSNTVFKGVVLAKSNTNKPEYTEHDLKRDVDQAVKHMEKLLDSNPPPSLATVTYNKAKKYSQKILSYFNATSWMRQISREISHMRMRQKGEHPEPTMKSTTLDGADARMLLGFIPNGESVRGTRFAPNARDPYSVLRHGYTGPMLLFHIVLVTIFFLPFAIKAGAWTFAEHAQHALIENRLTETTLTHSDHFAERFVWWVVLGFGEGISGVMMGLIASLFVIYNLIRVYVTRRMSLLRDAEERSGYLPEMREYWMCYNIHRFFLIWVYRLAMLSFAIHFGSWMIDTVYVPLTLVD